MLLRRHFLSSLPAAASLPGLSDSEIEARVRAARPLLGAKIPSDLKARLGATHYDGRYYFTQKPYLLEGCDALQKLGYGIAKFWFGRSLTGYNYNSDWGFTPETRLVDVARHPYFVQAFDYPFSTFALEIFPVDRSQSFDDPNSTFAADEQQFYDLALHLLRTYSRRNVTFLLQHWEGDWMLRANAGRQWEPGGPPGVDVRCQAFARWLAARQRGVERARAEAGRTRCRVYHAAEVNRVLDATKGIPTLTSHVLPHVAVDYVSWSCYDGANNPVDLWRGIDLIRHHMRPSPALGRKAVFIGEIGRPENGRTETEIVEWWDRAMGVCFAQRIPYIIHWELYCNEPKDGNKRIRTVLLADLLRGFWLIRPDGSLSYSAAYLANLLKHAGRRLPKTR